MKNLSMHLCLVCSMIVFTGPPKKIHLTAPADPAAAPVLNGFKQGASEVESNEMPPKWKKATCLYGWGKKKYCPDRITPRLLTRVPTGIVVLCCLVVGTVVVELVRSTEQCIISVTVKINTTMSEDIAKRKEVND